jgi:hypothetical protein
MNGYGFRAKVIFEFILGGGGCGVQTPSTTLHVLVEK